MMDAEKANEVEDRIARRNGNVCANANSRRNGPIGYRSRQTGGALPGGHRSMVSPVWKRLIGNAGNSGGFTMKILVSNATSPRQRNGTDRDIVTRLTAAMKNARFDCECRSQLDEALDRFAVMERRRTMRSDLSNACSQRRKIEAILLFLQDLDDLKATEQDYSVFRDVALLFDDIADAAKQGSDAMRRLYSSNDE